MIPLGKDYCIAIDNLCYVLKQRKVVGASEKTPSRVVRDDRRGEEYWVDVGYFQDIEPLVRRFTMQELSKCKDVQEIRKKLAEIRDIAREVQKSLEVPFTTD